MFTGSLATVLSVLLLHAHSSCASEHPLLSSHACQAERKLGWWLWGNGAVSHADFVHNVGRELYGQSQAASLVAHHLIQGISSKQRVVLYSKNMPGVGQTTLANLAYLAGKAFGYTAVSVSGRLPLHDVEKDVSDAVRAANKAPLLVILDDAHHLSHSAVSQVLRTANLASVLMVIGADPRQESDAGNSKAQAGRIYREIPFAALNTPEERANVLLHHLQVAVCRAPGLHEVEVQTEVVRAALQHGAVQYGMRSIASFLETYSASDALLFAVGQGRKFCTLQLSGSDSLACERYGGSSEGDT